MYTRILVPLDGSAPAEAVMNSAFECAFTEPSIVSSLVDGLEAETQTYRIALTDGVQRESSQTFSLIAKRSTAEATLAVADAIRVNRIEFPRPFQRIVLDDGSLIDRLVRPLRPSPILLILPRQ